MGDFSGVPLTGSVSGPYLASLLSSQLGRTVTAGEPYAQVFADGQIPHIGVVCSRQGAAAICAETERRRLTLLHSSRDRDTPGQQRRLAR